MDVLDSKTYFEEHAKEMISAVGMSKAEFAKAVGVAPQPCKIIRNKERDYII